MNEIEELAWRATNINDKKVEIRRLIKLKIYEWCDYPRSYCDNPGDWNVCFSNSGVIPHIAVTDYENREVMIACWLLAHNTRAIVEDIALHEVAHVHSGYSAGHGRHWKWWCRKLGCRPIPLFTTEDINLGRRRIT